MCGRFSLVHNAEEIRKRFGLRKLFREWMRRYNVAPQQQILMVRHEGGENAAEEVVWGLVPHWSKDGAKGAINARSESLAKKPTFRDSFLEKRCLIVADGFYEWQKTGGSPQPYRFALKDGGLFAFAGIYDDWRGKRTAAIITVGPNELMRPIHERMPAILRHEDEEMWTSPGADPRDLLAMLKPCPDDALIATPIGSWINDPSHEGEEIIRPQKDRQLRLA